MGFSSQAGMAVFRSQSAAGTFQSDLPTAGVATKLRSGALAPNRELLSTDPEIGGGRDTSDAYLGAISWSGDYEFYARMESLATFLRACLGSASSATTTGVNTHTISPSDSATLPYLSIVERIADGLEVMQFTDAVVNTLHLEAEANGYLMGTAGIIARTGVAGATAPGSPVWDNSPLTVGTNVTLTYGGVTLPAKSFGLDINNNIEDDDFRLGSFFLGDMTAKAREITGSFTVRPSNSQLWRQAVLGASAATTPGGLTNKDQLVITCTTYETIPSSTPATQSELKLTIPKVAFEPFALEPSGDDVIEHDISWRALRPVAATPVLTCTVKNGKAAVA